MRRGCGRESERSLAFARDDRGVGRMMIRPYARGSPWCRAGSEGQARGMDVSLATGRALAR